MLPNGEVLLCGGYGVALDQLPEVYNPVDGIFRTTKAAATNQYFCTATLLKNGKVLLSGVDGNELYDPATESFSLVGTSVHPRFRATAVLLQDGKVLICGGADPNVEVITGEGTVNAEIYDPAMGTFTSTGSMVYPRINQTATLLANGKVLIVGGISAATPGANYHVAELYDPSSGRFSVTGSLALDSYPQNMATLLPNGKVLVLEHSSRIEGGRFVSEIVMGKTFDPDTETFSKVGEATAYEKYSWDMDQTSTLLSNGWILLTGVGVLKDEFVYALLYNPLTGIFKRTGAMIVNRSGATATRLSSGKVLIVSGLSAELYDADVFVQ